MNKISFDFNNMMAVRIGKRGVREGELKRLAPAFRSIVAKMKQRCWSFMDLPYDTKLVSEIDKIAAGVQKRFKNLVVVGIGGSSLGNRTLHTALPAKKNMPRILVLENVDPSGMASLCESIDFKKTVFNIITKSGSTAETMANFMILRKKLIERVGLARHKEHIIVTTDPQKGPLLNIAREEGYRLLEIPSAVGGRFSVFSSVGLFSSAVSGIDIGELLAGARYMDRLCMNDDIWRNPGALSACLQYLFYKKGRHICVFMPYSDRLKDLSEWFAQLWAESLGKNGIGSTPMRALGVIDQHSQLQLYMEGPQDKVIVFVRVKEFDDTIRIPKDFQKYPEVGYLGGHTLNELIAAEERGTELALTKAGRPNCAIELEKITPFTIGALMYMLEIQTAFIGELFNIDAFNQPGVELSKVLTCALLNRPGYEKKRNEIEKLPKWRKRYCIE